MPVRSSLCTYSPSSSLGGSASAGSKYSSILPASSSLSQGHYKPLSSNSASATSFTSSTATSKQPATTSSSASALGRYQRLASASAYNPTGSCSSYSPHNSAYSSPSSSLSSGSPSSSVGHYKSLSSSATHNSNSNYSPSSSVSSSYSPTATSHRYGSSLTASPSSRYSSSSSSSSTGSLTSNSSSSSHYANYKPPSSNSAYSSGSGSLSSSSPSGGYSSPSYLTSRSHRRLSNSRAASTIGGAPLPPGVPAGLMNLGNTCYMNASIQALYSVDSFRNLMLNRHHLSSDQVLTSELSELFKLMKASNDGKEEALPQPTSPANFKFAFSRHQPKFSGFGQQDAQEFLRYLINGVHEDSNEATKRPRRTRPAQAPKTAQEAWSQYRDIVDDSPLVELVVGQLCSTITCCECQNKSHCWDPFWDLSLSLVIRHGVGAGAGSRLGGGSCSSSSSGVSSASTYSSSSWRYSGGGASSGSNQTSHLSDLIEEFTSKEVLDSDERPICSQCKKPTRSTKQISLARLPRLLILHLKKFTNDGYKLTSPEILIDKQLTFNGSGRYQLKACISHHGHSSSSGHYTAHCEYASKWFHFDDGRVRDVSSTFDSTKLDDAYVLFYTQGR